MDEYVAHDLSGPSLSLSVLLPLPGLSLTMSLNIITIKRCESNFLPYNIALPTGSLASLLLIHIPNGQKDHMKLMT